MNDDVEELHRLVVLADSYLSWFIHRYQITDQDYKKDIENWIIAARRYQ